MVKPKRCECFKVDIYYRIHIILTVTKRMGHHQILKVFQNQMSKNVVKITVKNNLWWSKNCNATKLKPKRQKTGICIHLNENFS